MKEAQDAEELRHRDSVPTDGLNTTQMQMLKEHLERESEKVIQTKCIKMKEHLELVIQGETGIRPQYTLLYDSPSARMAEAERRITDVDCSQKRNNEHVDQMQRQMAQMQMHIVQLQTNSVATDAMQKQVKRVDEMRKQVKIFALVDGPLTTDTMVNLNEMPLLRHRCPGAVPEDGYLPQITPMHPVVAASGRTHFDLWCVQRSTNFRRRARPDERDRMVPGLAAGYSDIHNSDAIRNIDNGNSLSAEVLWSIARPWISTQSKCPSLLS